MSSDDVTPAVGYTATMNPAVGNTASMNTAVGNTASMNPNWIRIQTCMNHSALPAVGTTAENSPTSRSQEAIGFRGGRLRPCSHQLRIAIWNVDGAHFIDAKQLELEWHMKSLGIDLLHAGSSQSSLGVLHIRRWLSLGLPRHGQ